MYATLIKTIAAAQIKAEGKKLRDKDANNTGKDDAGGRALEAIGAGIDAIQLGEMTNPASLANIGKVFVAVGNQLQAEADRALSGQ
jgi:hypothetical protein